KKWLRPQTASGVRTAERVRLHCSRSKARACWQRPIEMSSTGRKRIERSPQRRASNPRSNRPAWNSSRCSRLGRSNASINPRPRHHAADLRLFTEREQVRQHCEMFAAPVPSGDTHAALHLVENEKHVKLVAQPAQRREPFAAKMIVAAFALDRLDDDGGYVDG